MNRTVGIVLTVITGLCCGCFGLMSCIFGGLIASGQPIATTVNDVTTNQTYPVGVGVALICLAVIFIAIPIGVGFFTFRIKSSPVISPVESNFNGPIPPAS